MRVPIPSGINAIKALAEGAESDHIDWPDGVSYFSEYLEDLEEAFDLRVDDSDPRTSYLSHEIQSVTLYSDGSVALDYEVTTDTYYGCKDIDSLDYLYRAICGRPSGDYWEFDKCIYPEPRSTVEEF